MQRDTDKAESSQTVLDADRSIHMDLFCAECGYNLRTLPYVGRCTECGSRYNARPLRMEGIFTSQLAEFPVANVFGALLTWGLVVVLVPFSLQPEDEWRWLFVVIFAVVASLYTRLSWIGVGRFLRFRRLVRRIELGEEYND